MKIPQKIMKKKERGDIMAIVKFSKLSRPTVTKAMKSGTGSRKTVTAILAYYESLKLAK
jgi:hypothetical protein